MESATSHTIVTNSPTTSLSTSTTTEPGLTVSTVANRIATTATTGASIAATTTITEVPNTNTNTNNNERIHTNNYYCPIRAAGQVCICISCELIRSHLLDLHKKQQQPLSLQFQQQYCPPPTTTAATTTAAATTTNTARWNNHNNNKRTRNSTTTTAEAYNINKNDNDTDDNDDNDDGHHDTTPTSICNMIIPHLKQDDDTTQMAVTEVATPTTTTTTTTLIHNTNVTDTSNTERQTDDDNNKLQIMSSACRTILQCIGEDPNREGLMKTPSRWAKALLYLCHGYDLNPHHVINDAIFCDENHNEMIVVRNIDIHSLCEHHMVPFTGQVHIGYIPNKKMIGLSKLARLADVYARRLQVQERLTKQIATAICDTIAPLGVAVVIECTHYCMVMRGVQKTGTITTTSSVRGCFETNSKTRAEFFSILHGGRK